MTTKSIKQKTINRKKHLRRKGKNNGWLTIREAAELKGVTIKKFQNHLHRFKTNCKFTKIKYNELLINYRFRTDN